MLVVQPDYFSQGGVATSPYVLENMARFTKFSFTAMAVSKIEASLDGVIYNDITAVANTSIVGLATLANVCFKQYRITFTGTLFVNAT